VGVGQHPPPRLSITGGCRVGVHWAPGGFLGDFLGFSHRFCIFFRVVAGWGVDRGGLVVCLFFGDHSPPFPLGCPKGFFGGQFPPPPPPNNKKNNPTPHPTQQPSGVATPGFLFTPLFYFIFWLLFQPLNLGRKQKQNTPNKNPHPTPHDQKKMLRTPVVTTTPGRPNQHPPNPKTKHTGVRSRQQTHNPPGGFTRGIVEGNTIHPPPTQHTKLTQPTKTKNPKTPQPSGFCFFQSPPPLSWFFYTPHPIVWYGLFFFTPNTTTPPPKPHQVPPPPYLLVMCPPRNPVQF